MERASSSIRITLMANVDAALGLGLVEHIIHIEQRMQPCQARRGGLGMGYAKPDSCLFLLSMVRASFQV